MTQTAVAAVPAPLAAVPGALPPVRPADGKARAFRGDIEGLRGVAVLLVVAFHAGVPGWTGGFVGVDVFFVLSGYLITGLLSSEMELEGGLRLREFYARRVRRLLPASALVLLATLAAAAALLSPLEQVRLSGSALATAAYASNLWFMRRSTDYFAVETESNPLLHTWSLAVEEQFYLVWPLVVLAAFGAARSRRRLGWWIAALSLVSLVGCVWLTELRRPWAYFGTPARAWEFGAGALLCLLPAAFLRARAPAGRILGWAGLVALCAAAAGFSSKTAFPGYAALLPVAATGAILLAGVAAPNAGASRLMEHPVLQFLGRHSYSWYLWHWPLLAFGAALAPELSLAGRLGCAAASLGLAVLTYRWVERPMRFHSGLARSPGRTLAYGGVLTVCVLGAALGAERWAAHASARPDQRRYAEATVDRSRADAAECTTTIMGEGVQECVGGDTASARVLVLFGDSHGAHWYPAVEPAARQQGLRLVTLLKASCPPMDAPLMSSRLGREYRECARWREAALARIAELRPVAVLATSASIYFRGGPGPESEHAQLSPEAWRDGWIRTLATLQAGGTLPLLLHDSPRPGFNVPTCLSRSAYLPWHRGEGCSFRREVALVPEVDAAEAAALAAVPGARGVDLSDHFCTAGVCNAVLRGEVIYRDDNHLTATFAALLAPAMRERLDAMLPDADAR